MSINEAKTVILFLASQLDGKPSIVLPDKWKLQLARAISTLNKNNVYAEEQNGFYKTILVSKVNGTASTGWLPIKKKNLCESSSLSYLDRLFEQMLKGNSSTQQEGPDENSVNSAKIDI